MYFSPSSFHFPAWYLSVDLFMLWVYVCILSLDSEHHEGSAFLFVLIACVHEKVCCGGLYIGMHRDIQYLIH